MPSLPSVEGTGNITVMAQQQHNRFSGSHIQPDQAQVSQPLQGRLSSCGKQLKKS